MKDLGDIIDACQTDEEVTEEELRYAVCAMNSIITLNKGSLDNLVKGEKEGRKGFIYSAMFQYEERHKMMHRALNKDPKEWLGWNYDFKNIEYVNKMKRLNKIFEE